MGTRLNKRYVVPTELRREPSPLVEGKRMLRILAPAAVCLASAAFVGLALGQIPRAETSSSPAVLAVQQHRQTAERKQALRPLVLPNVRRELRKLQAANRSVQVRQLVASERVLRFWRNHRWVLAPRHAKCWEVPWQRSCTVARASKRLHAALLATAKERLDATDPVISRLNSGLSGTPMAGLGRVLRDEGRRMNVSPYFIAAAAGTESSFGAAGCGDNPRNVWGLAACDGRWSVPYFNSWEEAIRYYAEFIANRWPSATSPYHFYGYAACDACWGRKTAMWMTSRFGVAAYTKYPG